MDDMNYRSTHTQSCDLITKGRDTKQAAMMRMAKRVHSMLYQKTGKIRHFFLALHGQSMSKMRRYSVRILDLLAFLAI